MLQANQAYGGWRSLPLLKSQPAAMLSAAVEASRPPAAAVDLQQASAGGEDADSLWGDLGGVNLQGLDDWEEPQLIDVERLVSQLVQCPPDDTPTLQPLLQQLTNPDTPPYAIIGSEQWPQLAQLLPVLLSSSQQDTAAAAEQLLQQQLAPELLHCSPEPLAQLLSALLSAGGVGLQPRQLPACQGTRADTSCGQPRHQPAAAEQAGQAPTPPGTRPSVTAAAGDHQPAQQVYPAAVLQFMTSGLHKLGRQWHFLDDACTAAVGDAVVTLLLAVLAVLEHREGCSAASCSRPTQLKDAKAVQLQLCHCHSQQQQQQQQLCHLAVQLLLCDPMLSWWHRLNANSSSSRQLKAEAHCRGMPQQLLQWAQQWPQQQQPGAQVSSSNSGNNGSSAGCEQAGADGTVLQGCVAAHCLSALYGTPSGRRLLETASLQPAPVLPAPPAAQYRQQQPQHTQQAGGEEGSVPLDPPEGTPGSLGSQQPLTTARSCLQAWARLHGPIQGQGEAEQGDGRQAQQQQQGRGMPLAPWGPVKPAGLEQVAAASGRAPLSDPLRTLAGGSEQLQDGGAGGLDEVTAGVWAGERKRLVLAAAAATAAWALKACEEQTPWLSA